MGAPSMMVATLTEMTIEAARAGDTETVRRAILAGIPVNATNARGDSLLMLASYHGHAETVRTLLAAGADPDMPDARALTPLMGAAFKGHLEVVEALVDGGADVHASAPDGRTAQLMAVAFGRTAVADWLSRRGSIVVRPSR